jgi:transposase
MLGRPAAAVQLSAEERTRLEAYLRRESCTIAEQRRGRIVLLAADGASTTAIAKELDIEAGTVSHWRGRIARDGLGNDVREALADEPRSGRRVTIAPVTRLQISAIACDPLPDGEGLSGWTLDLLVEDMALRGFAKISRSSVHRILRENDIKPHRHKGWLHSPDPKFVEKVNEIVPLYLECPPGSVVVSFDEKTGMQAVERKHPDRPAGPGRLARQEFEYIRHGTQSLLATLNVHTGEVIADCGATRTGDDIERHMERVAVHYPDGDVHVVLDNLNIHKGDRWTRFNARHGGRFHFHYTPLHASWVNQIELFFGVLTRRSLRRKSFRSTAELQAHIMAFIARWNARDRKPFRWKFSGFSSAAAPTTAATQVQDAA